jgi:hypothetical protein
MDHDGQLICAVPADVLAIAEAQTCRWPMKRITWTVTGRLPGLSDQELIDAYAEAWKSWAAICDIQPEYTTNARTANVLMGSGRIDGPSGTLAWSELPCSAGSSSTLQQKYDTGENWIVAANPRGGIDIVRVAAHEVGHVLGLPHIASGNLLQPMYSTSIRRPQAGDIAEAVRRYGRPIASPTPTPTPTPTPPANGGGGGLTMTAILNVLKGMLPIARTVVAATPNKTDDAILAGLEALLSLIDQLQSGSITADEFASRTQHLTAA